MTTNFLDYGGGTGGFLTAPINILSTELNALTNGSAATSSVGGTSGVFTQSSFSSGPWCSAYYYSGGTFTPSQSGFLAIWWLLSPDAGSTFEALVATASTTVPPLPRQADIIVPLDNAALASGSIKWMAGRFSKHAWESRKAVLWNMSGQTLPATGNLIKAGSLAEQY